MTKTEQPFYGWKLVGFFFMIYFFNASFPYYGGTIINAFMAEDLGMDRSTLGLGFSVYVLALGLSGPLIGILINKIGIRASLVLGGAAIIIGSLLMSFVTTTVWQYVLFFGVIVGVGGSVGSIYPVQTGITLWFRRRKAMAMSIVLCASGIGALVVAPSVNGIINLPGATWREAWWLIAATAAIATVLTIIGVRDKPEDMGQYPDGIDPNSEEAKNNPAAQSKVYQTEDPWTMPEALKTPAFWLLCGATLGFVAPFNLAISHGVVHLRDVGLSNELATFSVGVIVMASIVGRLLGGYLGDRVELRFVWAAALLCVVLGVFFLSIATTATTVYLYAIFIGLGFGNAYVCMATVIGNYYGPAAFAPVLGILGVGVNLLGAASPILGGRAYDQLGTYEPAFYGVMIVGLIGFVMALLAVPPKYKGVPQTAS